MEETLRNQLDEIRLFGTVREKGCIMSKRVYINANYASDDRQSKFGKSQIFQKLEREMETKNCAVYVILGYDVNGVKDILGI